VNELLGYLFSPLREGTIVATVASATAWRRSLVAAEETSPGASRGLNTNMHSGRT